MSDILEVIRNLKKRLWAEYGDILARPYNQNEIHMTYYVPQILEAGGMDTQCDNYYRNEKDFHRAFIAGYRAGQQDADVPAPPPPAEVRAALAVIAAYVDRTA